MDPVLEQLAPLALALVLATLLAGAFERARVPGVLAELAVGAVLGNTALFSRLESSPAIHALSTLGALLLLFAVGLETELAELKRVGSDSFLAALAGVLAPFALAYSILPKLGSPIPGNTLFMAAALTATSVGITARVLRDLGTLASTSGRIILGAAVIDDVLGIIVLAIVSAIAIRGSIGTWPLVLILARIAAFAAVMAAASKLLVPASVSIFRRLGTPGAWTIFLVAFCLAASWGAEKAGLAGIIGAFAAGMALNGAQGRLEAEKLIQPLTNLLVPVFFIVMGTGVKLAALESRASWTVAAVLIACGIAGKLVCGTVISRRAVRQGADRWLVGFGMIPRGEVGLIFAAIGLQLRVLSRGDYAAVVLMAAATTFLAPFLLRWRISERAG